jgi:hypothetical protein
MSPDGRYLALVHGTKAVALTVLRLPDLHSVAALTIDAGGTGSGLSWSSAGALLASVQNNAARFYSPELTLAAEVHAPFASAVAFSRDDTLVAIGAWQEGVVHQTSAIGL